MAAAGKRIYIVRTPVAEGHAVVKPRLVRAQNPAQVVAHIAKPLNITVAGQDELFEAATTGVAVEEAVESAS